MKPTAKEFNLTVTKEVDERMHVEKSTQAACAYLKRAKATFGNWVSAAASYNCGMGGLNKQMEKQGQDSFFDLYLNRETSRYVFRILALKIVMQNPESFGFSIPQEALYQQIATREVIVEESIKDLALWAKEQGTSLRKLKVLNPWLVSHQLTVKGEQYRIKIPA